MPYDVPAGIAAFGGGLASGPGANNPFNNVFGSVSGGHRPDRSFEKVVRVMELERALSADRRRIEKERKAAEDMAELRGQFRPDLQELFDVDHKTAIAQQFPEPLKPSDRYRTAGSDIFDITGEKPRLAAQGRRTGEPLERVIGPDGQPRFVERSEAVGQTPYMSGGIQFHPDGTIKSIGGPAGSGLTRKSKQDIEADLITIGEKRQRINQIGAAWKPEYNQVLPKVGLAWDSLKDKFGALNPADQQALAEFTRFKQDALVNINLTIKEITGAAMTDGEAKRIRFTEPDPGQGPFAGDSPTEFKAKMDNARYTMDLAQARLRHLHANGIQYHSKDQGGFGGISLTQMEKVIDKYHDGIVKSYVEMGVSKQDAEGIADSETMAHFGLGG